MTKDALTLKDYGNGLRPAAGVYRADKIVIGVDGWPISYEGLRPYRTHGSESSGVLKDKWGRPLNMESLNNGWHN